MTHNTKNDGVADSQLNIPSNILGRIIDLLNRYPGTNMIHISKHGRNLEESHDNIIKYHFETSPSRLPNIWRKISNNLFVTHNLW